MEPEGDWLTYSNHQSKYQCSSRSLQSCLRKKVLFDCKRHINLKSTNALCHLPCRDRNWKKALKMKKTWRMHTKQNWRYTVRGKIVLSLCNSVVSRNLFSICTLFFNLPNLFLSSGWKFPIFRPSLCLNFLPTDLTPLTKELAQCKHGSCYQQQKK